MKTISTLLLLASTAFAQVKLETPHKMIPSVTSPFSLSWTEAYHRVDWFHAGEWTEGERASFTASPGVQTITVWVTTRTEQGRLEARQHHNRVLVVESMDAESTQSAVGYQQDAPTVPLSPADTPIVRTERLPYSDVTIRMRGPEGCAPCKIWMLETAPKLEEIGVNVIEEKYDGPGPQWKMLIPGAQTKWTPETVTPEWMLAAYSKLQAASDEIAAKQGADE